MMSYGFSPRRSTLAVVVLAVIVPAARPLAAQNMGSVVGMVTRVDAGAGVPGVRVRIPGLLLRPSRVHRRYHCKKAA